MQKLISLSSLLGLTFLLVGLFAIVYFAFERIGITLWLGVFYINGLTDGENWLIFVYMFTLALYIPIVLLWLGYRYYRLKNCSDIDDAIEQFPN
jgi:H+/Cl- antiporter ClcA